jgi:hypothetical protein
VVVAGTWVVVTGTWVEVTGTWVVVTGTTVDSVTVDGVGGLSVVNCEVELDGGVISDAVVTTFSFVVGDDGGDSLDFVVRTIPPGVGGDDDSVASVVRTVPSVGDGDVILLESTIL